MAYCDLCDRHFKSERSLLEHQENSTLDHSWSASGSDADSKDSSTTTSSPHTSPPASPILDDRRHFCSACRRFFPTDSALQEHHIKTHWFCTPCNRLFQSESTLNSHLRSTTHQPRVVKCPGCNSSFTSNSSLILHCEAGRCRSGVTRQAVNRLISSIDSNNAITTDRVPRGSISSSGSPPTSPTSPTALIFEVKQSANRTPRNSQHAGYECALCHKQFKQLSGLNSHLQSPIHGGKGYCCPVRWGGCNARFTGLGALMQHVENGKCGVSASGYGFRGTVDVVSVPWMVTRANTKV